MKQNKGQLLQRMFRAECRTAAKKYHPGDPVRARRFINTGKIGDPEIIAHPGDPGEIVTAREPSAGELYGLLTVRFGDHVVDLTPMEITPDWE